MQRAGALLASLAALVLTVGVASGDSPRDFVTGGGRHDVNVQFTVSAHSGSLGEAPKGQFSFKIDGEDRVRADVTCLVVVGNEAFITGMVTRGESPSTNVQVGDIVVMHAVDNGEPSDVSPDLLRFSFDSGSTPSIPIPAGQNITGCFFPSQNMGVILPPVPVEQGNITVHDAVP